MTAARAGTRRAASGRSGSSLPDVRRLVAVALATSTPPSATTVPGGLLALQLLVQGSRKIVFVR